ncbi:hypothetical protein [Pedobacter nutrimenti]|jgi:hypothetical protein|uniref:DUF2116 family Zn-ribbon domain-containing protein n=1 Tax=Pedobacter nutrimenti TaxID=1241337 RepID=A0A318UAF7_9SPHI|nr:hypothetical protein [Pedobacter nutrimenti]PYF72430.1 hypothetical protein B0O44_10679 [Pedobacter nutrimenti]|eukprot:gene3109-3559_t
MKKLCLECQEPFIGRSDKKFCDDQCRSSHYNRQHQTDQPLYREISRILKKNRRILKNFHDQGKETVSDRMLLAAGFDFTYQTHIHKSLKDRCYFFCFEYGYHSIQGRDFLLVKSSKKP